MLCPWHQTVARNMMGSSFRTFHINVLLIFIVLNLFQTTWTQGLKFKSVDALKQSMDTKQSDGEPLSLLWGIPDTTAYVGKLFNFTFPNDAFQGIVVHYDVSMNLKVLEDTQIQTLINTNTCIHTHTCMCERERALNVFLILLRPVLNYTFSIIGCLCVSLISEVYIFSFMTALTLYILVI